MTFKSKNIKDTREQKILNQEIRLFVKFLNQDPTIQEVNYDDNKITYRSNGCLIDVVFKI